MNSGFHIEQGVDIALEQFIERVTRARNGQLA